LNKSKKTVANAVSTPGQKIKDPPLDSDDLLPPDKAREFRSDVMRASYLSADRPDICFAIKDAAAGMQTPLVKHGRALKRLAKWLEANPRLVHVVMWQGEINAVDCYSDSDWAGDLVKRKSTSGMAFMHGSHCVHFLSSTQIPTALLTAEAEWYACVRTASRSLGLIEMARCMGLIVKGRLHIDSTATKGIAQRRGVGKIRHLATQTLWLQEIVQRKGVDIYKVAGGENPADLGTKHLATEKEYWKCLEKLNIYLRDGRSKMAFDAAQ